MFTLTFILAFGVAWEILEFGLGYAVSLGGREIVVQYGVQDTVFDLVFNTLAAVLVTAWGSGAFRSVVSLFARPR